MTTLPPILILPGVILASARKSGELSTTRRIRLALTPCLAIADDRSSLV
jgi:hypothetical protein